MMKKNANFSRRDFLLGAGLLFTSKAWSIGAPFGFLRPMPLKMTHVTTVGSNDATTISYPATGLKAGDIAILIDRVTQVSSPAGVIPTGFNESRNSVIQSANGGVYIRECISFKVLDGTEASTSITGINTSAGAVTKYLSIFRPNKTIQSVSYGSYNGQVANDSSVPNTVSDQVVELQGGNEVVNVIFACYRTNTGGSGTLATWTFSPPAQQTFDIYNNFGGTNYLANADKMSFRIYNHSHMNTTCSVSKSSGTYYNLSTFVFSFS